LIHLGECLFFSQLKEGNSNPMKKLKLHILILAVLGLVFLSCQKKMEIQNLTICTIPEAFQTERIEADNIDSPAIWQDSTHNWLISTAKKTDVLVVNDAATGKFLQRIGTTGTAPGCFKRPNGIFVIDHLALVVERDNHRVQVLTLPEFRSLGFIGDSLLVRPYGLFVHFADSAYSLYVTDCYETASEEIPADAELGRRVQHYRFTVSPETLSWHLVRTFGDTTGDGVLRVVESIYGDPVFDNLLVAEENPPGSVVKVYDFAGNFKGKILGAGIMQTQAEGIALYQIADSSGYWILTDQSENPNRFHVFDRRELTYLASFTGPQTTNTDGIWLTQTPSEKFPTGAFYAVHNDGNVSAFDWRAIADSLKLKTN